MNKICPKCGKEYSGYPAISRVDNKTEICPDCGVAEAFDDYINHIIRKEKEAQNEK